MHEIPATPAITPPSASDYKALVELFNQSSRALANREIDFPTFQRRIAEIDERTRALDLLSRLSRKAQSLAAREGAPGPSHLGTGEVGNQPENEKGQE